VVVLQHRADENKAKEIIQREVWAAATESAASHIKAEADRSEDLCAQVAVVQGLSNCTMMERQAQPERQTQPELQYNIFLWFETCTVLMAQTL